MEHGHILQAILREGQRLDNALDTAQAERLADYFALLVRWGKRIRLTGGHDPVELVKEHLADALVMSRELGRVASFVDVGSGGGLPAIPYLLLEPAERALLVEVNQRKSAFLRTAAHELGLPSCEVRDQRVETLERSEPPFTLVSSRATFAPAMWLEKAGDLIAPGGRVLVFVAREERLPPAAPSLRSGDIWRYELADGTPRTLACYHRSDA